MSVTPLRTINAACHEATVELLADLLARAQRGEVIGIECAIECASCYEYAGTVSDRARGVGMLQMAVMNRMES